MDQSLHTGIRLMVCQQIGAISREYKLSRALILPGMTGRALVIGTLLTCLIVFGFATRVAAQLQDEEEISTDEISDESSVANSGSDEASVVNSGLNETSFHDDLADDWSRPNAGSKASGRSLVSQQPSYEIGNAEVIERAYAESHEEQEQEQEDMSTGEISDESSVADSGSDEASFDDDLLDDRFESKTRDEASGRPPLPLRSTR